MKKRKVDKEREKKIMGVVLASFDVCDFWEAAMSDTVSNKKNVVELDRMIPLMNKLMEQVNDLEECDKIDKTRCH